MFVRRFEGMEGYNTIGGLFSCKTGTCVSLYIEE